jgi:hypothetical protein
VSNDPNDPYGGYGAGDPYGQPPGGGYGGQPPGYPSGGPPPGYTGGAPPGPYGPATGPEAARRRVKVPAILLIIAAGLNLLWGGRCLLEGAMLLADAKAATAEVQKQWDAYTDQQKAQLQQMGLTLPVMVNIALYFPLIWGIIALLASLVTLFGGIRMLSLRSRGLALFGAVLAALPCISPTGCCAFGQLAGIWAIIVLLNSDVKAAFR